MEYSSFAEGFESGDAAFTYRWNGSVEEMELEFQKEAIRMASRTESETPTVLFGKKVPQPKVGAILVTKDLVYCSARSAYEIGNHAEHTAIETLASDQNLSDAVLFTTLEPCTAESRHEWTKSCTNLIMDRKIKKVFMGTPDANPLVTGLGVKRLFDYGVDVHFFDVSFRKDLNSLNREFFDFFNSYSDAKSLKIINDALGEKIDWDVVSFYESNVSDEPCKADSPELRTLFYRDMVLKHEILDGKTLLKVDVTPSFALLFFKDPSEIVPGYRVNFYKKGNNERVIFKTSLLHIVSTSFWDSQNIFFRLFPTLDNRYHDRGGDDPVVEAELEKIFYAKYAGRELLINALIHNDFKACPSVSIYCRDDFLECIDCCPATDTDVELMSQGKMISFPTNPRIMDVFEQCHLAEARALGMQSVTKNTLGLPLEKEKTKERQTFSLLAIKKQTFICTKIAVNR
jgi:pyrimidine deaminase RibD-like protein